MDVEAEVAGLRDLGTAALRQRWQALTGQEAAPGLKGELLRAVLAYKLQEQAFGGLRREFVLQLAALANPSNSASRIRSGAGDDAGAAQPASRPARRIKPGSRLLREWQGRMHEVVVMPQGYLWDGEKHASLSTIARRITGTSWNGWRFFGLVERKGRGGDNEKGGAHG